jgi:hypothetical protein
VLEEARAAAVLRGVLVADDFEYCAEEVVVVAAASASAVGERGAVAMTIPRKPSEEIVKLRFIHG